MKEKITAIIELMSTNQIPHLGGWCGLGWEMHDPTFMGKYMADTMIAKRGYTGCLILLDMKKHRAMVLLSNRTYPQRPPDGTAINKVRTALADVIFED